MVSLFKLFSPNILPIINRGFVIKTPCFTNIQTAHWSSYTKIVQKLRIPDQPKQPKSAFLRFVVDIKGEIQYETVNDLAREASIQWKQLPEEQKKKYCDASEEEFKKYRLLKAEYKKNLTAEQKNAIKIERKLMENKREKSVTERNLKNELKALGKPTRPITSFSIFLTEKRKNTNVTFEDTRNSWSKLSNDQKQVYKNKHKQLFDIYEKQLIEWEDKMLAEGRGHLVRKKKMKKVTQESVDSSNKQTSE